MDLRSRGGGDDDDDSRVSRDDTIQDTSFVTADEGTSVDGPGQSEHIPSSSRRMPVPSYLEKRAEARQRAVTKADEEDVEPPPSYDEATREADSGDTDDGRAQPEGAEGGNEDELSPEEIAVVMKMQADRGEYLQDRRASYDEAIEMIEKNDTNEVSAVPSGATRDDTSRSHTDNFDNIELGDTTDRAERRRGSADSGRLAAMKRILGNPSPERVACFAVLIMLAIGLILFLSLFPASFVYVDYHEIALKQSKLSNRVDRDTVYYTGCYVLGPDTRMLKFVASNNNINDEMSVFTVDTIKITVEYSLEYFLRPNEVGKLYTLFVEDYDPVFRLMVKSTLRVLSGTQLTVENFRFNRTFVEKAMHAAVRKKLGGNCCPTCCPDNCQSNSYCNMCKYKNCDQGYHVDVRFFHLLAVKIPNEVFERYLRRTILEIEKEKEFFLQEHAVIKKESEMLSRRIRNEANEMIEEGQNQANKIRVISEAEKEKQVQAAYVTGLHGLYSRLNVTKEEHKTSLMMIRALEDNVENLYSGYGFEKHTLAAP